MKQANCDLGLGGTHPTIYHPFLSALFPDLENKTILDIGCGKGIVGFLIRIHRNLTNSKMIGLDASDEYLSFAKKHNIYDKLIKADLRNKLPLKDGSLDFIICSEVIEHLTKSTGEKLLDEIDRIAKDDAQVIITTPNVWLEMPFPNSLDQHRSLWGVDDFQKRGYKVRGIGVKLAFNKIGWYTPLIQALYYFMTPFSYLFPRMSGLLIAHKVYSK